MSVRLSIYRLYSFSLICLLVVFSAKTEAGIDDFFEAAIADLFKSEFICKVTKVRLSDPSLDWISLAQVGDTFTATENIDDGNYIGVWVKKHSWTARSGGDMYFLISKFDYSFVDQTVPASPPSVYDLDNEVLVAYVSGECREK